MKRNLGFAGASVALILAVLPAASADRPPSDVPHYTNDATWPKPFAHHWVMGQVGGMAIDRQDRIWVLQRALPFAVDEKGARHDLAPAERMPAVMVFDTKGNIVKSWGGQGYVRDWPKSEHGLWVDQAGNVWIGGNAPGDRQVLKFTNDGRQLLEIGRPTGAPRNNADTGMLGEPAGIEVDDAAHEVYISDGYLNNRVVVYDSDTGKFKRGWGAYGIPLSKVSNSPEPTGASASTFGHYVPEGPAYVPGEPPEKQFRTPVHCVHQSMDGLVYVCDRRNDRIQVFTREGKFVKEFLVHRETRGNGSVWTLSFSHDPAQKYLIIGDGVNQCAWILGRNDGAEVASFGKGYLFFVHQSALDSKGDYYTGDVGGPAIPRGSSNGKSVQKFVLQPP